MNPTLPSCERPSASLELLPHNPPITVEHSTAYWESYRTYMNFLEIEEKAEVLRDNTDRLLEDRREQTNAWFQRLMRQMVVFFILGAVTYGFGLWYTQNLISTPLPALIHLT